MWVARRRPPGGAQIVVTVRALSCPVLKKCQLFYVVILIEELCGKTILRNATTLCVFTCWASQANLKSNFTDSQQTRKRLTKTITLESKWRQRSSKIIPKWTPKGASHASLPRAFKVTRRTVARRAPKAELNSNLEPLGSISAPFPATIRAQKFVTIAAKSRGLENSTQQSQREPIGKQKDANTRQ